MQNFNILTRRAFLDRSFKTSLAVALATLTDIPFVMKRALAEGSIGLPGPDGKIKKVIFIWLRGANDDAFLYTRAIKLGNGFAALHPSLKFLAPIYNAGDPALLHRVAYPRQSRSHFDSQDYRSEER